MTLNLYLRSVEWYICVALLDLSTSKTSISQLGCLPMASGVFDGSRKRNAIVYLCFNGIDIDSFYDFDTWF